MLRTTLLLACLLHSVPAAAIVIRHDVPDAAYLGTESDFPAVFGIYRTKAGHKECVATLIAPRWAITAAHCTRDRTLVEATAAGGPGFMTEIAGIPVRIDRVVTAPKATASRPPDIALLHLNMAVRHVAPVALYRQRDEAGRIVIMPGWGGTGNGKSGLGPEDGLFRVAENRVDTAEPGKLWWRFDEPGQDAKALTLEGISGPGDSGGPAFIRTPSGLAIAGVSSAQDTKDGPEGLYGVDEVFVRLSEFAPWILATMSQPHRAREKPAR